MEHPDVTSALRTGYAAFQCVENRDSPENWDDYLDEYQNKIMKWLKDGYQDILKEFAEIYAPRYGAEKYEDWLN